MMALTINTYADSYGEKKDLQNGCKQGKEGRIQTASRSTATQSYVLFCISVATIQIQQHSVFIYISHSVPTFESGIVLQIPCANPSQFFYFLVLHYYILRMLCGGLTPAFLVFIDSTSCLFWTLNENYAHGLCFSLQVFLSIRPPGPAHEEARLKARRKRVGRGGARKGGAGGGEVIGERRMGNHATNCPPCSSCPQTGCPDRPSESDQEENKEQLDCCFSLKILHFTFAIVNTLTHQSLSASSW